MSHTCSVSISGGSTLLHVIALYDLSKFFEDDEDGMNEAKKYYREMVDLQGWSGHKLRRLRAGDYSDQSEDIVVSDEEDENSGDDE